MLLKKLKLILVLLIFIKPITAQDISFHPLTKVEVLGKILPIKDVKEIKGDYSLYWLFDKKGSLKKYRQVYNPKNSFVNSNMSYYFMDTHYKSNNNFSSVIRPVELEYKTYYPIEELDAFGEKGELISQKLINGLGDTIAYFDYNYNEENGLASYKVKSLDVSDARKKISKATEWNYDYIELDNNGSYKSHVKLKERDTISLIKYNYSPSGIKTYYEHKDFQTISKDSTIIFFHLKEKSIPEFRKTRGSTYRSKYVVERTEKSSKYNEKIIETTFDGQGRPIIRKSKRIIDIASNTESRFSYNENGSFTEEFWWIEFDDKHTRKVLKLNKVNSSLDDFPALIFRIDKFDSDGKILSSIVADKDRIKQDLVKVLKGKKANDQNPSRYIDFNIPWSFSKFEYDDKGQLLKELSLDKKGDTYRCYINKVDYNEFSKTLTEFDFLTEKNKKNISLNVVLEDIRTTYTSIHYEKPYYFTKHEFNNKGLIINKFIFEKKDNSFNSNISRSEYRKDSIISTEFDYRMDKKKISLSDVQDIDTTNFIFYKRTSSLANTSFMKQNKKSTVLSLKIIRSSEVCNNCDFDCTLEEVFCNKNGQLLKDKNRIYKYDDKGALILLEDENGIILKREYTYHK
jgi:hypothetical protein